MLEDPVRLTLDDDLARSRLTTFFRLLLALPHLVWWALWTTLVVVVSLPAAIIAVVLARLPGGLHGFFAAYVRYSLHLYAYLTLAANPFPGFLGRPGSYPLDAEIDPPVTQNRWSLGFRWLLSIPAWLLAASLTGMGYGYSFSLGVAAVIPLLAWFAILARGTMPPGFRDALVYALGYTTRTYAYALLLTPRFPDPDPAKVPLRPLPDHPVGLSVSGAELRRNRLTVFFRLLLALPLLVWAVLWGIAVYVAIFIGWVVALFTGFLPDPLHRFAAAFLRFQTHVSAYLYLVANPFPGFTGAPGSYPVELRVPAAERQGRWMIFFRLWLTLPAFLVAAALGSLLSAGAVLGWFFALVTGRMPRGLRDAMAYALRYTSQTYAYGLLLTPRYPYSGPGPCD